MSRQAQLSIKRLLDVTASCVALTALSPLLVFIAVLVKLESEGPIFFVQERIGLRATTFRMRKFRTMQAGAENAGSGLYVGSRDPRITRVGKWLRRFSLDELPQLAHVITGQMSMVGPRPALPYQLQYYTPQDQKRLLVRPGLTGWSQVNGRNQVSWPSRLERDVWYVEHFSLALDLKILLRTPVVLLSGEGLYGPRENFFFTGRDDLPVPTVRTE